MRRRAAVAAVVVLCALAAAVALGSERAPASHDKGAGPGRSPLCHIRPDLRDVDGPGILTGQGGPGCVPAVARNLVGDAGTPGKPIPVCAGPNHDQSTKDAIALLNAAGFGRINDTGSGRPLFTWAGAPSAATCPHELGSGRISSIEVTGIYASGGLNPVECGGGLACAVHYSVRADPDYGYVGRAEARINPRLDVVTSESGACAPAGHTYDPLLAEVGLCTANLDVGRADGTLELTWIVAHELMHIVGLRDYKCGIAPLNSTRSLMDTYGDGDCAPPRMASPASRKDATKELATAWDRAEYQALYSPAKVTGQRVLWTSLAKLRLGWTAGHVHAERGFAVERWTGSGWQRVTLTGPNVPGVTIDKPSSAQRYQVVSVTDALGTAAPPQSAISGEVRYTPPPVPTATPKPTEPVVTCWDGSEAPTRAQCPADTRPVCWDGSRAATQADCPADTRPVCWDGSRAATQADCPADTRPVCWDGSRAATQADCPADTRPVCWDGSRAATQADCPADTRPVCWDGSRAATQADCPADTRPVCWDGSRAATQADCPADTRPVCWDGSRVATQADCPPEPTPEPTTTVPPPPPPPPPKPQPTHTCWNGAKVYSPDECEPEPPRCFDPFFNEVPCPPVDPCSEPHFPGCSRPPDPVEPPDPPGPPEATLPPRPRELAARGAPV